MTEPITGSTRGAFSAGLWRAAGPAGLFLLLAQLLGLVSARLVSNALGPLEYGRYGLALAFSIYATQFVQWGLDPLVTRMLARADAGESRRLLGQFIRQKHFAGLLVALSGAALAGSWRTEGERFLIYLGLLDGVALAWSLPAAFDARRRTGLYYALGCARQIAYLAAVGLLSVWLPQWLTTFNVLVLHAACIGLQVLVERTWVHFEYGKLEWAGASSGALRLSTQAVPMAIAAGSAQLVAVIGVPALYWVGLSEELGYLVVSNQLATAAMALLTIPARLVHARLAAWPGDAFGFRRRIWLQSIEFCLVGICAALVLSSAAPWIVTGLFGTKYAASAALFAVDVWRAVGVMMGAVFASALICEHRLRALAVCNLLALCVSILFAAAVVAQHGARGAAASIVVGRAAFALSAAVVLLATRGCKRGQNIGELTSACQ